MKKRAVIFLLIALLFSLTKALAQEIATQHSYENKNIGVQVTFPEDWTLHTTRDTAPDQAKNLFPPDKGPDDSPLFIGMNANQQAFSILSVEKYDGTVEDYFELLYFTKQNQAKVSGAIYFQDQDTIQWIYELRFGQINFSFVEAVTVTNGKAVRLSFWTLSALLQKYQPVFEKIISQTLFLADSQGETQWVGKWRELYTTPNVRNIDYVEIADDTKADATTACQEGGSCALWEVKGKNNTVYLFGSIHLGKPEFYPFNDKIESAFKGAQYLAVELDVSSAEAQQKIRDAAQKMGTLKDGKTLEDVLSKPVYRKLVENFESMGIPFDTFKNFRPWLVSATLEVIKFQSMGYVEDYGIDRYFLEKAAGTKEVVEMETISDQLKLFETMDNEQFLAYTMLSLNSFELRANKLITAWRCGDLKTLQQILLEDYGSLLVNTDEIYEKLFFERNRKMAAKIKEYLKGNGNYFVVVGAGHYLGEKGIVSLLKKEGYEVNRI